MINAPLAPVELVVGGKTMPLARWPNFNSEKVSFSAEGGTVSQSGQDPTGPKLNFKEDYVGERLDLWLNMDSVWIDGILAQDWEWTYNKVKSFHQDDNAITLKYGEINPPNNWGVTRGLFFTNVLEEIDRPGEYFIDTETGILYFYPNQDFHDGKDIFITILADHLVTLDGPKHVILENLVIANGRRAGVVSRFFWEPGDRVNNVILRNLTIENVAGRGIAISGKNNLIEHCIVRNTGHTGISISGGFPETIELSGNRVSDNYVHSVGALSERIHRE